MNSDEFIYFYASTFFSKVFHSGKSVFNFLYEYSEFCIDNHMV
jgi:hypothetical protein